METRYQKMLCTKRGFNQIEIQMQLDRNQVVIKWSLDGDQ